ncbi:hypothetical protein [Sphingobium lactosutens]|uniref:hypothetical protein n=1 Tax=Sphingobium lactosutens TaxID=522773 RepID=UPI0021191CA1|nr:hypothetical protein [Sphingobium lactosutens]
MQPKSFGRSAPGRGSDRARIVTVGLPTPYEGVGDALRSTYRPPQESIPDDMMALLMQLDRF